MKIKWNEVTRFSQIVAIVLFVVVFFVGFWLGRQSDLNNSTGGDSAVTSQY